MIDLCKKEKYIVLAFIITTILALWLISPMGQLYLPIKKEGLEKSLSFELPNGYTLKHIRYLNDSVIYDLERIKPTYHVLSIIVFKDKMMVDPEYINPFNANNELRDFWVDTKLKNFHLYPCNNRTINKKEYNICYFEALWPNLNHDSPKEGEYCLLKKGTKSIFISSIASKYSYNPDSLNKLIVSIFKKSYK